MCAFKIATPPITTVDRSGAFIAILQNTISFNSRFMAQEGLDQHSHVQVHVDSELFRIGFKFHSDSTDYTSYVLSLNGGAARKGKSKGRILASTWLFKEYPWLGAVAQITNQRLRRFVPVLDRTEGLWVIHICPSFEKVASDDRKVPAGIKGVYRYRKGEETVYIGQGIISTRLTVPERKNWSYDRIEYSEVNSEEDRLRWESFWISKHEQEYGKKPIYNRYGGRRKK